MPLYNTNKHVSVQSFIFQETFTNHIVKENVIEKLPRDRFIQGNARFSI